jgi:aspartate/methionine/tyrosine aminotransferase
MHANVTVIPAYIDSPSPSSTWPTASLSKAIIPALEEAYASAPDPSRIKALLTSNPNNPFMRCWPRDVLRGMMEFCQKHGLHYVSDEVFANTVFDEADAFVSALELVRGGDSNGDGDGDHESGSIDPNLVHVIWSTTKDFGACGVRSVSIYIKPVLPLRRY